MTQFTIPQIPKQNGIANCKNQTLVKCASSMLQQSKLNKTFWAKAIAIATYVKKLSPIMVGMGRFLKRFGLVVNHQYLIYEYLGVMHILHIPKEK
jgi:hypothetical protein